jgi:hypothetical protein
MSIENRIKKLADDFGGVPKLAEISQLKPTTIYGWIKGPGEPRASDIAALSKTAGVSVSWIVNGEDEASLEPTKNKPLISSFDPDEHDSSEYSGDGWMPAVAGARPEIDVRLGAGEGSVGEMMNIPANGGTTVHKVVGEWLLPENFLTGVMGANAAKTFVMEIVGDSMETSYHSGDRVVVDLDQNKMVADTVYAISDGYSEPQIKRLQRIPFTDPPRVKIISDNPNLESYEASLEQVQIIGRICGVIARR